MILNNILMITDFVKENNLRMNVNEGLIITDSEGCLLFQSDSKTKCFAQAAAWIAGNECERLC